VGITPTRVTTKAWMSVYPYQLADGSNRWYYVVDLPASTEGRRRQRKKRGCYHKITDDQAYCLLTRCRDGGI